MSQKRVVIFANGVIPDDETVRPLILPEDVLIAADGGSLHALRLGFRLQMVIGDMDSLPAEALQRLNTDGTEILRFPPEKDKTDLELSLRYALDTGCESVLIIGALGGRLDQTLGNLSVLTDKSLAEVDVRCDDGQTQTFFIRHAAEVQGDLGDTLSLLPWGGPVADVVTENLLYPLKNETLYPNNTRGISNQLTGKTAQIRVGSGLLLCVHIRKEK